MNASGTLHLGISFDQNYLAQFYALSASLFDHNRQHEIVLHVIVTGISEVAKMAISAFVSKNNATVHFYSIDEAQFSRYTLKNSWTTAVYYRLMFPLLLPKNVTRLLYVDTDTLILKDLGECYFQELGKYPVAAVYDIYVKKQELLGITEEGQYFNSGVLLMNIPVWNERKISERCFEYLSKYPERILYVDQCALNAVLRDSWKHMDYRMNCLYSYIPLEMSSKEMQLFIDEVVILHYTMHGPWKYLCKNPYRHFFGHYLRKSGYAKGAYLVDFHWKKIPLRLQLNLMELYFRSSFLKSIWRTAKNSCSGVLNS